MNTISDVFAVGLEQVRKSWGWFLASGILLTILGVVCIGKAQTATTFSILALGWVLVISGVLWLISSFYAFSWHGFFLYMLNAIIRGVTGYLLIRHPDAGAQGVTMLLAALFIVGGIFRGVAASVIQFPRWGWTVFSGLVSLVLGIYLLATWPAASTYFIGVVIGIDLIFDGSALVGFAGAIHSLPKVQRKAA
ncbi:MAG TPA: HdeD family acid-resistance protein [Terriglobales bacterium]|nr:HdeD family acid-resistance protein [Terriglobales bacterium]